MILIPAALGVSFLFGEDLGSDDDNSAEADALLAAEATKADEEATAPYYGADGDPLTSVSLDDFINGTNGNDMMLGHADDDTLDGGDGSDTISSGSGDDSILGGSMAESLNGNDGNDFVSGEDALVIEYDNSAPAPVVTIFEANGHSLIHLDCVWVADIRDAAGTLEVGDISLVGVDHSV
ncbi:hypothetical protein [Planktotalea sp.]|uniref:hypothetical protein n=1 Tax=Planktotalea sp. TaxID=2029877 RepID=UPI0025E5DE76|nr:hypothetical protein [Planktotalea sp.]